jgi:uncharacterized protein
LAFGEFADGSYIAVNVGVRLESETGGFMKSQHGKISALEDKACRHYLARHSVGRIGCYGEGRVYVVPITYAFEDDTIYGYSRPGQKIDYMRQHPEVCFEIDEIHGLRSWTSVIASGRFEELKGDAESQALRRLMQKISLVSDSQPESSLDLDFAGQFDKTIVFQIKIKSMSGRYENF